jgi:hypothetical protein
MLATILIHSRLVLLPLMLLPPSTTDCQLDVLTPAAMEERALGDFNLRVNQYVRLHRRLERALPPEQMFDDPEDMFAAAEALRSAILDARPNARPGSVFTPAVADIFVRRLTAVIPRNGVTPALWPILIDALPPLPDELQYRFEDRDLVLLDVHADLVVDVLRNALPSAAHDETFW